ncbi:MULTISPECIES: maleylpyruvate isomerase family mycothiol-dependent enzyme [unclassified Nocardioides]|uniref:maleylpyruvate isomerase family mycothiol-dependent enzyme n=1 Tax=unclassified Nocardioides TaxID=2615069 RepID=UPI000057054D|nr:MULTISPECIES: maleylpyruvate isomerase family mycothiol-dependent enzyme [unclassified Nocardioides]ABL81695.1 conserved hypothetical protein [Nocardioides sp. JS614]
MNPTARDSSAAAHLTALGSSVRQLRAVVEPLGGDDLTSGAYTSEWSVADVLSHLGSGAVISMRRLEDTLAGRPTPDDHAPGVWEEWNAKTPMQQRSDALEADTRLLTSLKQVPLDSLDELSFPMGPMTLTFTDFVAMRLNEHVFHTWDIAVVTEPSATLLPDGAALVVDNLGLVARFTARPTGDTCTITVRTSAPTRTFSVDLTPDAAALRTVDPEVEAEVELPAEAFARLVYGRLDPDHTPPGQHGDALDQLRHVFPGP